MLAQVFQSEMYRQMQKSQFKDRAFQYSETFAFLQDSLINTFILLQSTL